MIGKWHKRGEMENISFPGSVAAFPFPSMVCKPCLCHIHRAVLSRFRCVQLCATPRMEPTRLLCPWDSRGKKMEWVAMSSSRGSSDLAGGFFTTPVTTSAREDYLIIFTEDRLCSWLLDPRSFLFINPALSLPCLLCENPLPTQFIPQSPLPSSSTSSSSSPAPSPHTDQGTLARKGSDNPGSEETGLPHRVFSVTLFLPLHVLTMRPLFLNSQREADPPHPKGKLMFLFFSLDSNFIHL